MINPTKLAKDIETATKALSGHALVIDAYANSIKEQKELDFSGDGSCNNYQQSVNSELAKTQSHADDCLNVIVPHLMRCMGNIDSYYLVHQAVITNLPMQTSESQWSDIIKLLYSVASRYLTDIEKLITMIKEHHKKLKDDTESFTKTVEEFNKSVGGDEKDLIADDKEMSRIESRIEDITTDLFNTESSMANTFWMIIVGHVVNFKLSGVTNSLVVGGAGILTGGSNVVASTGIKLKDLMDEKSELLMNETKMKPEVKLAMGVCNGAKTLQTIMENALEAAMTLKNNWYFLTSDLENTIEELKQGQVSAAAARVIFFAAIHTIEAVMAEVNNIKQQLQDVTIIRAKSDQKVGDAIIDAVQSIAS